MCFGLTVVLFAGGGQGEWFHGDGIVIPMVTAHGNFVLLFCTTLLAI